MTHETHDIPPSEKLLTYKQAAAALGIPYYKIQRAAHAGLIPTYQLLDSKRYVKISDIMKIMAEGP